MSVFVAGAVGKKPHARPFRIAILQQIDVQHFDENVLWKLACHTVGDEFQTGQGVSIREDNIIGSNVSIGTNSVLEFGNKIGDNSRIHSNCFLEMVTIGRFVFIGPHVVFTDDPHPMGCPKYKQYKKGAIVEDFARIGANTTILPGVRIVKNSLIGAGAVVTKDVPENSVVIGNPAKVIKKIH